MNFVVVTNEWLSEHGIIPLPTMRKSKDGSKIIMHEDYLTPYLRQEESEVDNENPNGWLPLERYPHGSKELDDLLASEEWSWSEEAPTESADFIQVAAVRNLMTATKANIQNYSLTNKEVNTLADMLPEWEGLIGTPLPVKYKQQYNGKPYRTNQAHTPQEDWKPDTVKSLYGLISDHDGTLEDPIPYERWLVLEKGKYYTQYGVTYKCVTDSIAGYDADLTELMSLLEVVSQEGGAE